MSVSNRVYRRLYRSASDPEELPWSHTDPCPFFLPHPPVFVMQPAQVLALGNSTILLDRARNR